MTTSQLQPGVLIARYLTATEMAATLGPWTSEQGVRRMARLGQIPYVKWGNRVLFDPEAVHAALERKGTVTP